MGLNGEGQRVVRVAQRLNCAAGASGYAVMDGESLQQSTHEVLPHIFSKYGPEKSSFSPKNDDVEVREQSREWKAKPGIVPSSSLVF